MAGSPTVISRSLRAPSFLDASCVPAIKAAPLAHSGNLKSELASVALRNLAELRRSFIASFGYQGPRILWTVCLEEPPLKLLITYCDSVSKWSSHLQVLSIVEREGLQYAS
ncbi:hypothetical protein AAY473_037100 [Plecturocebus cupreus]